MPGWLTDGINQGAIFTGAERFSADTGLAGGQAPQTEAVQFMQLAAAMSYLSNFSSKTTVSGTRYSSSFTVGAPATTAADGAANAAAPVATLTGLMVLVGSVGGTDAWIVELHDSTGALVATSATAGTTAGTAGTWQQIPFTSTYQLLPGTYFLSLQSNGTTAHPACYNFPAPVAGAAILTQAATGVFGTGAAITPPTTYTVNVGPVILPY